MIEGSLSVFLAALDDLLPYAYLAGITPHAKEVKTDCEDVLNWLRELPKNGEIEARPRALGCLAKALDLEGDFIESFNKTFHVKVSSLGNFLREQVDDINKNGHQLEFQYLPEDDAKDCFVLTLVSSLKNLLSNYTIEPILKETSLHSSLIKVYRVQDGISPEKIVFRLLTSFGDPLESQKLISLGRSGSGERLNMERFGVKFDPKWDWPSEAEQRDGFKAAWELKVMSGYMPRRS